MISGHTWNILNHKEADEVYLQHARNSDHYIDANLKNTNAWFEKKRRVDGDGDGIPENLDSSNVQEVMFGPPDHGKEATYLRQRQSTHLRQSEHPRDFGMFSARKEREGLKTPERAGFLGVKVPHQERLRDIAARASPRVLPKSEWTPRRDERAKERAPPSEYDMFRNVAQLMTESHMNVFDANLADAVHSGSARGTKNSARSVLGDMGTTRSQMGGLGLPPKPGAHRQQHSVNRVEPHNGRELTGWYQDQGGKDKLKREDAFFSKPVANMGSSCVKYDIISNERKGFWY